MLGGDVTVVVTLFSNVLPQSAVLQCCLRKLWIHCPPGQACEHRKALISNFMTLQGNSRRSWPQWRGEKISPEVVIHLSELLGGMVGEWDADLDMRTLEFHSYLGHAAGLCPCASALCQLWSAPHRGPYRSPN